MSEFDSTTGNQGLTVPGGRDVVFTLSEGGRFLVQGGKPSWQVISGDGAITIPEQNEHFVKLTKGSAAAITLAIPTLTQNGKIIRVWGPAYAHIITVTDEGFNAKGSTGTATSATPFTGILTLVADNKHWYAVNAPLWTIA